MKKILLLSLLILASLHTYSQYNYRSPLDIPLVLAANFGELRPHHFHTGLDLKTQAVVNKNVYSIEEGYVSRIGVNAGGYGLVLYITHPNGHTSVYGHLNSFAPKIAAYTKQEQYKHEKYVLNIDNIEPHALPVKKGEIIAKSGNTGSSGGPHVHFELRETKTDIVLDPLPYFQNAIKDDIAPEIRGIAVYPIEGKGIVNNSTSPFREKISLTKTGSHLPIQRKIEAWGEIGIGVYAIDRMTGTHNIYGIKEVNLYCNNEKIFSSDINTIDFGTTRMINSFTDFDYWKHNKQFYMKSFIDPGNKLHIYDNNKKGYINIDEEKVYNLRYELKDVHGNKTHYSFIIEGVKSEIPKLEPCSLVMHWNKENRYISDYYTLSIPKNHLYRNINFVLNRTETDKYFSDVYTVHNSNEPLNDYVEMSLQLSVDTLLNSNQYGIVAINNRGKENWIGGSYSEGYITTQIRELGETFAVTCDTIAPLISPIAINNWTKESKIILKVTDNLSGIQTFKGTIDDKFALFEHDIKSPNYTYKFDSNRLAKGKHQLVFTATDNAGNMTTYETDFIY